MTKLRGRCGDRRTGKVVARPGDGRRSQDRPGLRRARPDCPRGSAEHSALCATYAGRCPGSVGLLSLWEARGDGKLPSMSPLAPSAGLDPYAFSSAGCVAEQTTAAVRWKGLAPALAILDRVNPAVAGWVREKHAHNALLFRDDYRAKGEQASRPGQVRHVPESSRREPRTVLRNDGTIAVTLCHEYRHSRQNLGKVCQYALSCLFAQDGDLSIIENDAVIYEQEAQTAIFGPGKSRQNELAAWGAPPATATAGQPELTPWKARGCGKLPSRTRTGSRFWFLRNLRIAPRRACRPLEAGGGMLRFRLSRSETCPGSR